MLVENREMHYGLWQIVFQCTGKAVAYRVQGPVI
jgi:hypothetical protein